MTVWWSLGQQSHSSAVQLWLCDGCVASGTYLLTYPKWKGTIIRLGLRVQGWSCKWVLFGGGPLALLLNFLLLHLSGRCVPLFLTLLSLHDHLRVGAADGEVDVVMVLCLLHRVYLLSVGASPVALADLLVGAVLFYSHLGDREGWSGVLGHNTYTKER